jgi:hypothetical protein
MGAEQFQNGVREEDHGDDGEDAEPCRKKYDLIGRLSGLEGLVRAEHSRCV